MQRRDFITLLGGVAAARPLVARAQQRERLRRIGVLMNITADDPEAQSRMTAFVHELGQLGWTDGRNIRIDTRWAAGDADRYHRLPRSCGARAGRDFGLGHPKRSSIATGNPHRADRICKRHRSGWRWLRR